MPAGIGEGCAPRQPLASIAPCASRIGNALASRCDGSDKRAMDDDTIRRLAHEQGLDRAHALFPDEIARAIALAAEQRALLAQWPLDESDAP